jgi:hypothetical protein
MNDAFRVYVAAPFARAATVRLIHNDLRSIGCKPSSEWVRLAKTPERLEALSPSERLSTIELNDACIDRSHAMIVRAFPLEGGEMFVEMARAITRSIPVLWVGSRTILSAFRPGVFRCNYETALAGLKVAADAIALGGTAFAGRRRLCAFFGALKACEEENRTTEPLS